MPIEIRKTYEYKLLPSGFLNTSDGVSTEEAEFNALGAEGWELVLTNADPFGRWGSGGHFLFRRVVESITVT